MNRMTCIVLMALLMFGSSVELFPAGKVAAEPSVTHPQADNEDSYIAGYAAAILERDFQVSSGAVQVQHGVIIVNALNLAGANRQKIVDALSTIRGVTRVELQENGRCWLPHRPSPRPQQRYSVTREAWEPNWRRLAQPSFPTGISLTSYSADPRWPHFSLAYIYSLNDKELGSAGTANFGETLALYRNQAPFDGQWEFGIQAGVFSLFDLEAESKDLINADYVGGLFASYRTHDFSMILQSFIKAPTWEMSFCCATAPSGSILAMRALKRSSRTGSFKPYDSMAAAGISLTKSRPT